MAAHRSNTFPDYISISNNSSLVRVPATNITNSRNRKPTIVEFTEAKHQLNKTISHYFTTRLKAHPPYISVLPERFTGVFKYKIPIDTTNRAVIQELEYVIAPLLQSLDTKHSLYHPKHITAILHLLGLRDRYSDILLDFIQAVPDAHLRLDTIALELSNAV